MICPSCGYDPAIGEWPLDCKGRGHVIYKRDAAVHTSERVRVIENPSTGEIRIPGRTDRPIHPKYQKAGFTQYKDLTTLQEVRQLEKKQGLVHEASNYDNSGRAERDTGSR